jgi:hypothetical protein
MSQDRPSPSDDELTVPANVQISEPCWTVVAHTPRVNRSWEALMQRAPENARRCYEYLSTMPMQRSPGRVFPLRGKRYKGAWEYEVTKGDRVFYKPIPAEQKVVVYYAGEHPKAAPEPP